MTLISEKTATQESIEQIKDCIRLLLNEEKLLTSEQKPSAVWQDAGKYFLFLLDLSFEQLKFLRLHTSLFTGDPWFNYIHSPDRRLDSSAIKNCEPVKSYLDLTASIPERFWCTEPILCDEIMNVGLPFKNLIISDDLLRFQKCITNSYNLGIFKHLESINSKPILLEVGGGYGHLAHQFSQCLNYNCTYIIIDLPSSLLWSALYLHLHNPSAEIYIHSPNNSDSDYLNAVAKSNFIFIPNHRIDLLEITHQIDFGINLLSFQEMTSSQVDSYCKVISSKLKGFFYSENCPKHWMNQELDQFVEDILSKHFQLLPPPEKYLSMIPNPSNPNNNNLRDLWIKFFYICKPKSYQNKLKPIKNVIFTQVGDFQLDEMNAWLDI